jgi:hypothetical protein
MDEHRNRGIAAVRESLGGGRGTAEGWSTAAWRPLLTALCGTSCSKGFSKGRPARRLRTTRGGCLRDDRRMTCPGLAEASKVATNHCVVNSRIACWLRDGDRVGWLSRHHRLPSASDRCWIERRAVA